MKYNDYLQATEVNKCLCSTIAMEECGELIQAISKAKRGKLNKINLSEEIADVLISINWIRQIYNISDEQIEIWFNYKSERIIERLNKGDFN